MQKQRILSHGDPELRLDVDGLNGFAVRARLLAGEAGHVDIECPIQRALHIAHWRPHCRLAMGQSTSAIGPDHITEDFVQVDQTILDKELSILNILVRCYLMCKDAAKH